MQDNNSITIPDDLNERVEWALGDITTAVQDFSTAYNIAGGITTDVADYVAELNSVLEPYPEWSDGRGLVQIANNLLSSNESDFEFLGGLGTLYAMYSDVVLTMLDMIDSLEDQTRQKVLNDIKNGLSLDELFESPPAALASIMAEKGLSTGTRKGVQSVFSQILRNHNGNVAALFGGAMLGTASGFSIDTLFSGKMTAEDIKRFGILLARDTLTSVGEVSGNNPFLKSLAENMSKHSTLAANSVVGFILQFGANVAIALVSDEKDFGLSDVQDSAVKAAIATTSNVASKALIGALCNAIGVSASGGPAAVAIGVVSAVLTYAGSKLYDYVKKCFSMNGDGIPKKYQHMSNEELLKMMHDNGYSFGVPSYPGCDESAFDLANKLARAGASDELITFVEAGAGAGVPVDCLYQDSKNGVINAKTQAIIDFFTNSNFVSADNTDEYFRSYTEPPDQIYDGYADEYNEQIRELWKIFGFGGISESDEGLGSLYYYLDSDFICDSNTANNIETIRQAQQN